MQYVAQNYALDGVLTLVDAKHIGQHLDERKPEGVVNEALSQVAYADRIILNKTDLVRRLNASPLLNGCCAKCSSWACSALFNGLGIRLTQAQIALQKRKCPCTMTSAMPQATHGCLVCKIRLHGFGAHLVKGSDWSRQFTWKRCCAGV